MKKAPLNSAPSYFPRRVTVPSFRGGSLNSLPYRGAGLASKVEVSSGAPRANGDELPHAAALEALVAASKRSRAH